jgi:hypothetical protein
MLTFHGANWICESLISHSTVLSAKEGVRGAEVQVKWVLHFQGQTERAYGLSEILYV